MKKILNTYYQILSESHIKYFKEYRCRYEKINLYKENIITEYQDLYPIPKEILSYYIKEVYQNGFYFVEEVSMKLLIDLIDKSENKDKVLFNIEKFKLTKDKNFLFICLPMKEQLWLNDLKEYFDNSTIKNLFQDCKNENGVYGTYSKGFLMVINADVLNELKDIQEIVEHQFIHLFREINNDNTEKLSFSLIMILQSPKEFETYTVNLINRLDKIYNNYCIKYSLKDSINNRKNFLDKIFSGAQKSKSVDILYHYIKQYDSSKLLYSNLNFLWQMCTWHIPEFSKFQERIYNHFLK